MPKESPVILVTNDDGVHAPGLIVLAEAMRQVGTPVVVAPDRDNSAVSHSLTLDKPLRVRQIKKDVYTVDGTPADCVTLALEKILPEKPKLIVSGINPGGNLGHDISYSGTVSAAKEGTIRGVPAAAFSMSGEYPFLFETAIQYAVQIARTILAKGLPSDCFLNVNIPNKLSEEIRGLAFTRQGRRMYENALQEIDDPWGRVCYWIGGGTPMGDRGSDTDAMEILNEKVSITPIHLDLTNYEALDELKKNWIEPEIV